MRIERLLQVPAQGDLTPSTMYIVKAAEEGFAEIYFSTKDEPLALVRLPTVEDIDAMIAERLSDFQNVQVVADIPARNALELGSNSLVLVLDATGDETVNSGAAMYFYSSGTDTFYKVSEFESLDLNITWDSLVGKPTSSAEDIDDAVQKRHMHENLEVLDGFSDQEGVLNWNNEPVGGDNLVVSEW